jgi:hypothetical protein
MSKLIPENRVKVVFGLKRGEDGYPPADVEQLWAKPLGDNLFEIGNIPFFVKGISYADVVEAVADPEGELWYRSLVRPSTHETLRVIVFRESSDPRPLADRVANLRRRLGEVGCSTELSHMPGLVAVDGNPASIGEALLVLKSGEADSLWEYEEGALRTAPGARQPR